MAAIQRVGDLEIALDLDFQRRSWTVQRVAWIVIGMIVLAALLGPFGSGPMSEASAGDPSSPLYVEYGRFGRFQAPTAVKVTVGPGAARDGEARVWLHRDFTDTIELQQVTPQPDRVEAGTDRLTYVFPVPDASQGTTVTFHYNPDAIGFLSGQIGLADGPDVRFTEFVYP